MAVSGDIVKGSRKRLSQSHSVNGQCPSILLRLCSILLSELTHHMKTLRTPPESRQNPLLNQRVVIKVRYYLSAMHNSRALISDVIYAVLLSELDVHVPVNGAMETITIHHDITWHEFRALLADTMDVSPKSVSVAYRFSVQPQSTPYSHLSTPKHLDQLFPTATAVKKASRSQKPFAMELKRLDVASGKVKASSKGGKDSARTKEKRKRKVSQSHLIVAFDVIILTFSSGRQ